MKKIIILATLLVTLFANIIAVQAQENASTISTSTSELNQTKKQKDELEVQEDDTIYVIGSQDEAFLTPGSASFIGKEEIQEFNYSDPVRLLQKVPGVYIQDEDGHGLRPNIGLRGAAPHRSKKITLMEDGILIGPAPYSAPAAYYFPNMMKTSNMEVFKGPSAVRYGPNSIGGAINMVTNPIPQNNQTEISATLGDINKYEVSNGAHSGKFSYLLEYNRAQADGFKTLPSGGDTGFTKDDVMFKGKYRFGSYNQSLSYKLSYSEENSHETYLGLTNEDFAQSPFQRYAASENDLMQWDHQLYNVTYSIKPQSDIKVNTTAYYHKFNRNWSRFNGFNNGIHTSEYLNPSSENFDPHFLNILRGRNNSVLANGEDELIIGNNNRKYYSTGVQMNTELLLTQGDDIFHTLNIGARYHQDQITRLHTEDYYRMQDGSLVATSRLNLPATQNRDFARAITLFIEDEIDFSNGLVSTLGVRVEDVNNRREVLNSSDDAIRSSYQTFIPGIGLQYSPTTELNLIAGVNKGLSTIAPGQSEEVLPEESINYELGAKYRGAISAELIGFYNDYQNIKGFCSFSSGCVEADLDREFNGGQAQVYGFESQVSKTFKAGKFFFPITGSFTKTVARFTGGATSSNLEWGIGEIREGDPLPYIPEDKLSLNIGMKFKRFSTSLIYNWQNFVYDQAVQEGRETIPAFSVIDLSAKYRYTKGGEIFTRIDNLLATDYMSSLRPFGARPGRPQSFSVGLRHVF